MIGYFVTHGHHGSQSLACVVYCMFVSNLRLRVHWKLHNCLLYGRQNMVCDINLSMDETVGDWYPDNILQKSSVCNQ